MLFLRGLLDRARDTRSGDIVAVKRVKMQGERGGLPQSTLREIAALKQLDHENIVRLASVCVIYWARGRYRA